MLIKGEKYACEACVRGHRVSNCQHSDRPLQHINKKGRPVSQCTHCRTLRKSRSAHVRCDCGSEKTHAKGACTHEGNDKNKCCCSHGGRCSCALKKDHLDPVPESDSDEASPPAVLLKDPRRPRALTAQSDNGLTVFTNGHHKPGHKHNNMASKCGLPYVVPRAHSIHGQSPAGYANRSVDNLPHMSTVDALHSNSQIKDSIVSAQQEQRKVKSEHGSPISSPMCNLNPWDAAPPALDLSHLVGDYSFLQSLDGFSAVPDQDQPIFSAGLSADSVDWSHYDGLEFNNDNFAMSSYSQAPSFTGFDFSSIDQPALTTTSTSGEISEVEDYGTLTDAPALRPTMVNRQYGSDFDASDYGADIEGYRLSTASSFIGLSQGQMLSDNDVDGLDMDAYLLKGVVAPGNEYTSNSGLPLNGFPDDGKTGQTPSHYDDDNDDFSILATGDDDTFWMQNFNSNTLAMNGSGGRSDPNEDNVWAQ